MFLLNLYKTLYPARKLLKNNKTDADKIYNFCCAWSHPLLRKHMLIRHLRSSLVNSVDIEKHMTDMSTFGSSLCVQPWILYNPCRRLWILLRPKIPSVKIHCSNKTGWKLCLLRKPHPLQPSLTFVGLIFSDGRWWESPRSVYWVGF